MAGGDLNPLESIATKSKLSWMNAVWHSGGVYNTRYGDPCGVTETGFPDLERGLTGRARPVTVDAAVALGCVSAPVT